MKRIIKLLFFSVLTLPVVCFGAPVVWTDGGVDGLWETTTNWDTLAVPGLTSAVTMNTTVSAPPLYIDSAAEIASLTIGNGFSSVDPGTLEQTITTGAGGTLQIDGSLTNNNVSEVVFALPVIVGATATWSGPLNFSNSISLYKATGVATTLTLSGAVAFTNTINLTIDSATVNSAVTISSGGALYTGATIKIFANTGYVPVFGDSWSFTNSNFSGATLDLSNITLGSGLSWNDNNFQTNGTLSVIPEPSTWLLLAGGLTTVMVFRCRKCA